MSPQTVALVSLRPTLEALFVGLSLFAFLFGGCLPEEDDRWAVWDRMYNAG